MRQRPLVLIVEDHSALADSLAEALTAERFECATVGTVAEALAAGATLRPDVVLLDLVLPDGSGPDVCRALRAGSATAAVRVVVLSALADEIERVLAFELGADDFVPKPFSVRELVLRLRAVLRRAPPVPASDARIEVGRLAVDPVAHRVFVDGREVPLTATAFRLLVMLIARRPRVQPRDVLIAHLAGDPSGVGRRSIDTHVRRLREALGAAGAYVRTVRGVGYRFDVDDDGVTH